MNVSPLARTSRPAALTAAGRNKPAPPGDAASRPNPDQTEQETALTTQRVQFDFDLQERAELQREMNELRALEMEQLKRDDEILKKWIAMI